MSKSAVVLAAVLTLAPIPAADAQPIFADGFESGDVAAWSSAVGVSAPDPCLAGAPLGGVLAGDLGPAPASTFEAITCLEVANDTTGERRGLAGAGIPLPRALGLTTTGSLAVIGPGERRHAAQFEVLARWGGRVDDASLPIRWLGVTVEARVAALGRATYALRRYPGLAAATDPFAVTLTADGGGFVVDTGLATFTLDPANPALLDAIAVDLDDDGAGRTSVYTHTPGAGPRLAFEPGGGVVVLSTAVAGRVSVDAGGFEIVESGPARAVVMASGHFSAPGGASLCSPAGVTPYERFGYTVVATFERGRRDVGLELHVRNECSDAAGWDWTDEAVTVRSASWELPFPGLGATAVWTAGLGPATGAGSASAVVEQRKGGGSPWRRRARILRDGAAVASGEALSSPLLALEGGELVVAASMPWMRYREPQALAAVGSTLSLRLVSEDLVVGEGKGLWGFARLALLPRPGDVGSRLETLRTELADDLERRLLVRAPRDQVSASGLFPSLGTDASSPIKSAYEASMAKFHDDTVSPGGQWDRAKTFGSQVWPDVQYDVWAVDNGGSPLQNDVAMNYWNPSGAELFEFLRTGEPRWAWDFALPQSWLQMHTAYVNVGEQNHGNRNGFAATSGGSGEGQWHRSAYGSDDYSYNGGQAVAYVLQPSPVMRRRFAQAGRTVVGRYAIPWADQSDRELWVNQVDLTRQVVQHLEMLANCAEFVPGADGLACHAKLLELVEEIAYDNLRAGLLCQGDVPTGTICGMPQKFMTNALIYPFLERFLRNYGDYGGRIRAALIGEPRTYYQYGMPKLGDGTSLDVNAAWAAILECTTDAGGTAVLDCQSIQNGDGDLLGSNKPHSVALLLMAHELDPSIGLCGVARTALDEPGILLGWNDYEANDPGWWKGAAQMMQSMVFGVGIYDTCVDP